MTGSWDQPIDAAAAVQQIDVLPRLLALLADLRSIPGIHARLDVTITVTMVPPDDGSRV